MRVSNAARLTDEEMQAAIDAEYGQHVPPLVSIGRGNRAVADAATAKAETYWQERVRELVAVAEDILTLNVLDGFRERLLRAALAPLQRDT